MDEKKASKKKIEFKPPEGFMPPENIEEGHDWDMVCSFRTKPDGMICMTKLGETPMPGYGGDDDEDHKPSYKNYSKGLMEQMGESSAPAPDSY